MTSLRPCVSRVRLALATGPRALRRRLRPAREARATTATVSPRPSGG